MSIDIEFLSILRCPESGAKLREAAKEQLAAVNQKIKTGTLSTRSGAVVSEAMTAALVTVDGQRLFQMLGDIPNLVIDDAIDLTEE